MHDLKFEFWHSTGKDLFSPTNDQARELCKTMRRKNLTAHEVEFYHKQGYNIELRPRVTFLESIRGLIKNVE